MIFGVDEHRHVYWFYPAWRDATEDPRAVGIARRRACAATSFLEAVRHDFDGASLQIRSLFLDAPLTVSQVEAMLRQDPIGPMLPIPGAVEATTTSRDHSIEVAAARARASTLFAAFALACALVSCVAQPRGPPRTRGPATFALIIGSNVSVDAELPPLKYADDDAALYLDLFRLLGARTYLLRPPRRQHAPPTPAGSRRSAGAPAAPSSSGPWRRSAPTWA